MTIVADSYQFVIGVDTHAKQHQYAIVDHDGRIIAEHDFRATPHGLAAATRWVRHHTDDARTLVAIDGASSYGRQLATVFTEHGIRVVEAPTFRFRPHGKDDRIDARHAATATLALTSDALGAPRDPGDREALQLLLTGRDEQTRDKTRHANALVAILRRHDLGIDARTAPTLTRIRSIAAWGPASDDLPIQTRIAHTEAIRHANEIVRLHHSLARNARELRELMTRLAPALLTEPGIGPISAATLYAAWSHRGRIHSEAAFARLAGVAPKPASSGNKTEHRLDRGGDRRLNAALHRIVITRSRKHPDTLAYYEKRRAAGLSDRRIRRCLKRHLARHIYRVLESA